jgi:hypothetical protein
MHELFSAAGIFHYPVQGDKLRNEYFSHSISCLKPILS